MGKFSSEILLVKLKSVSSVLANDTIRMRECNHYLNVPSRRKTHSNVQSLFAAMRHFAPVIALIGIRVHPSAIPKAADGDLDRVICCRCVIWAEEGVNRLEDNDER